MPARVMIVDDSVFFRYRLKAMLESDSRLEVVGEAGNGAEAIEVAALCKPDIITMDIEMPVMDGISATRHIMQAAPCPILVFSSLISDGAQTTLDALQAGAVDYLPKRFEDISPNRDKAAKVICDRIYTVSQGHVQTAERADETPTSSPVKRYSAGSPPSKYKLVAIGASTGGPMAVQDVLAKLPANFALPILVVQHMPGSYTHAFASRLNQLCAINVKEAEDGDTLQPGTAYLAPGDRQLLLHAKGGSQQLRVVEAEPEQTYKPSVDITLNSIAKVYPSQTLAMILSGMGEDGLEGAHALKNGGSEVWSQDEQSCVVYGMPAAVVGAGLSDKELALNEIAPALMQL